MLATRFFFFPLFPPGFFFLLTLVTIFTIIPIMDLCFICFVPGLIVCTRYMYVNV